MKVKSILSLSCIIAGLFAAMSGTAFAYGGGGGAATYILQCKSAWKTTAGESGMTPQYAYSPTSQAGCFASAPTVMLKMQGSVGWPNFSRAGTYTTYYITVNSLGQTVGTPTTCSGTFNYQQYTVSPCS